MVAARAPGLEFKRTEVRLHGDVPLGRTWTDSSNSPCERAKNFALIGEDAPSPVAAFQGASELAKKRGLQVVFAEPYPRGPPISPRS